MLVAKVIYCIVRSNIKLEKKEVLFHGNLYVLNMKTPLLRDL